MPLSTSGRTISTRRSTIFEQGDLVRVPFPHVERALLVPRPALVLSVRPIGPDAALIWTAMITNAARVAWPGDVAIPGAESLGLLIPSKVRTAKIATSEARTAARIGRLNETTLAEVMRQIRAALG